MMLKKEKLKFEIETPITMTLSFANPKEGEGAYGKWYLYGVVVNKIERSLFAFPSLHEQIQKGGFTKGDTIIITQHSKNNWSVIKAEDISDQNPNNAKEQNNTNTEEQNNTDVEEQNNANVWEEKDKRMARMNALNRGFDYVIAKNLELNDVFKIAEHCFNFIWTGEYNKEIKILSNHIDHKSESKPIHEPESKPMTRAKMIEEICNIITNLSKQNKEISVLAREHMKAFYNCNQIAFLSPNFLADCWNMWDTYRTMLNEGRMTIEDITSKLKQTICLATEENRGNSEQQEK